MAERFVFRFILVALLCLASCTRSETKRITRDSSSAKPDTADALRLLKRANQLAKAADYEAALIDFETACEAFRTVEEWSRFVYCRARMGSIAVNLGQFEVGRIYLDEALSFGRFHLEESDTSRAVGLTEMGALLRQTGNYSAALNEYEEALSIRFAAHGGLHPSVAHLYNYMALTHQRLSDYKSAEAFYNEALRITTTIQQRDNRLVASLHNNLGMLHRVRGDYDQALKYLEKSVVLMRTSYGESHPDVAIALKNLGETYRLKGHISRAVSLHQQSVKIARGALGNNHPQLGIALNDFGIALVELGRIDEGLSNYKEALRIYEKARLNISIATTSNNMGVAFRLAGDYDRALGYLDKACRIYRTSDAPNRHMLGICLNQISNVHWARSDYRIAREYSRQALDAFRAAFGERHPYVANQYKSLARIASALGEHEVALADLDRALDVLQSTSGEDDPYIVSIYRTLADVHDSLGVVARALEYHEKALERAVSIRGQRARIVAEQYNAIANFCRRQGRFEQAISYYDQALAANLYDQSSSPDGETDSEALSDAEFVKSVSGKARIYSAQRTGGSETTKNLEKAFEFYQLGERALDRMQTRYRSEGSRLHWLKWGAPLLAEAVEVAYLLFDLTGNKKYKEAAFYFAEKSRGNLLLRDISDVSARQFADVPDSLLRQERTLFTSIISSEQRLRDLRAARGETNPEEEYAIRDEIFAATSEQDALVEHIERSYPAYHRLKYTTEVARPESTQAALDGGTAIVEYVIGDNNVFIFTLSKKAFNVVAVPKHGHLEELIEQLRRGILEPNYHLYTSNALALYDQLLKPVLHMLDGSNLVIVPDGILNYVPFEALLTATPEKTNYDSLPYLINRFAISYAYSSTLYLENRGRQRDEPTRDYVAFAPVFENGVPGNAAANLFDTDAYSSSGRDAAKLQYAEVATTRRRTRSDDPALRRGYLPMTRVEVSRIEDVFTSTYSFSQRFFSNKTRVYLGKDARESVLAKEDLGSYRYVHFATHGFANSTSAKSSGILFYPPEQDATEESLEEGEVGPVNDGVLRADEVYALKLNADVVVLSACETGFGPIARGEGVLSLARGFLYAGASNVVASLWKADDAQTQKLMLGFYKNMIGGQSTSASLRAAKLDLIRGNPHYARPYYWATFVLIGE